MPYKSNRPLERYFNIEIHIGVCNRSFGTECPCWSCQDIVKLSVSNTQLGVMSSIAIPDR